MLMTSVINGEKIIFDVNSPLSILLRYLVINIEYAVKIVTQSK